MILTFKDVTFQNFLSYGNAPTTLVLNKHKHTIVTGKNGQGKSQCILDTISYALFGKPYRKITLSQLINSINKKNCLVTLNFSIGQDEYKIIRGQKPSIFQIFKNGELIQEDAASRDYQEYLETNILKINFKTFKQIILIGSAGYTPFMNLSAAERRGITEDVLDISIFSTMLDITKELASSNKSTIEQLNTEINYLQRQIKSQKETIDVVISEIDEQEEKRQEKIAQIESDIAAKTTELEIINQKISSLEESVKTLEKQKQKRKDLSDFKLKQTLKKKNIAEQLKFFDQDSCPTCSQKITEEFRIRKQSEYTRNIGEVENLLCKIEESNAKLAVEIDSLLVLFQEYNVLKEKANTIKLYDLQLLTRTLKEQSQIKKQETKSLQSSQEKLNTLLVDLVEKQEKKNIEVDNSYYLKYCLETLKDSGIKSKIISTFIPMMNQMINEYLQLFDLFISFELDETFNETIKSRNRDSFSYNSFSEGEKMKINLAILFAWRKIAITRNQISTNLLIFDEVMDASMDSDSVNVFVDILNSLESHVNSIVITHKDVVPELFDRQIVVEKVRDFSILKE